VISHEKMENPFFNRLRAFLHLGDEVSESSVVALGWLAKNTLTVVAMALLIGSPVVVYLVCQLLGLIYPAIAPVFLVFFVLYVPFVVLCFYCYFTRKDDQKEPERSALDSVFSS